MADFVVYHNTEGMGYRFQDTDEGSFGIVTKKPVAHLVGETIWIIAGEGRDPRRYSLCARFEVDRVGPVSDDRFRRFAEGDCGTRYDILLNEHEWFWRLWERQNNFSLGLNRIDPESVRGLERLIGIHA
jgi:hypothetical protein